MANPSRQKGDRFEREVVNRAKEAGLDASRVPLSGAAGGEFSGDVILQGHKGECKTRKRFIGQFLSWLEGNHFLFVKEDRSATLVVMRMETLLDLLKGVW